ncbi:MAG: hypothetical protein QM751_08430 [Paludibacteraceae bacterium]
MISSLMVIYIVIAGVILFVFRRLSLMSKRIDDIFGAELRIRDIENSLSDYLLHVNGFCFDDFICGDKLLKTVSKRNISQIESELFLINKSNYPLYYYNSRNHKTAIIKEKPTFGSDISGDLKQLKFVLDISGGINDTIVEGSYKIIFNKNRKIMILYPDGEMKIRFFL